MNTRLDGNKAALRLTAVQTALQVCLLVLLSTGTSSLRADLIFWAGGDGVWDNSDSNWSPLDEPDPDDDVVIGGTSNVLLGSHNAINSLSILSGASLRTEEYGLSVADQVTVTGTLQVASNTLAGNPPPVSLYAGTVEVIGAGELRMANSIEIEDASGVGQLALTGGGTLYGNGNLHFADQFSGTQTVLNNNGVITVGNVTNSLIPNPGAPPARTLHVTSADLGARFDLDGNGGGIVNVRRNGTLNVDGTVTDFSGLINLSHNATLDISNGWTLGDFSQAGATLAVDNGFVSGGILGHDVPADVAYIKGGQVTMNNPNTLIDMVDDDGALTFDAPLQAIHGKIQHRGTLTFNAPAFLGFAVDLQNTFNSDLVINAPVTINDPDWDWDSTGSARTITINEGGSLTTSFLNTMADDLWSANMYLNGGTLTVETLGGQWGQNAGTINVGPGANSLTSTIGGGTLFEQTNGSLHVNNNAFLNFDTDSRWSNGTMHIHGLAWLNGKVEWAGSTALGDGMLIPTDETTVSANTTINVGHYVLNQADTTVEPGVTFTIDVDGIDSFPGGSNVLTYKELTVDSGTLDLSVNSGKWRVSGSTPLSAGRLNLINSGAGTPTLQGSTLRTEGTGRIQVNGNATILSELELGAGVNGDPTTSLLIMGSGGNVELLTGGLILDGGSIHDNIDRSILNSSVSLLAPMTVTGESTVNVEVFDWDGSTTTVMPNGTLHMLSGGIEFGSQQQYDSQLTLNSGEAEVDLSAYSSWTLGHTLNLNNSANKIPVLSGDHINVGNDNGAQKAFVNVGGNGISDIEADVTYQSDAELTIAAGATLRHKGSVTFDTVNGTDTASFAGPGSLVLGGTNTINETTILNMSGGSVDLDNSSYTTVPNNTHINDWLIITAAHMEDYGNAKLLGMPAYSEMYIADAGQLFVQLDGVGSEWTVNDVGIIHYSGDSQLNTFLSGDDVNLNGTLNVTGHGIVAAQMDISGEVNLLTTDAGLRLAGGSITHPNRLLGGTINGNFGILSAYDGRALLGSGVIHPDIDFTGNSSRLLAESGTLMLHGDILNVGVLGTANNLGILNVAAPWNTQATHQVTLNGGQLNGALITNDGTNGINGFGLITANVVNNTRITAENGTLILDHPSANILGSGLLHAAHGDLRVQYGLPVAAQFTGQVRADGGYEFYADQFQMNFVPTSQIDLEGGTFRSNQLTQFGGQLSTVDGFTSRVDNSSQFVFTNTSQAQLNGDLELLGSTTVNNGATLSGTANLINLQGSALHIEDGAVLGVTVENHGLLSMGSPLGEGAAHNYIQGPTGEMDIQLLDVSMGDFDSLLLNGAAQLDGLLNVSLLNNFMPDLGDEFTIISTANGVTGMFDAVNLPTLSSGLGFGVFYEPNDVILRVESMLTCDFTGDGLCDIADLDALQLVGPLATGTPAVGFEEFDLNSDGTIDLGDRAKWLVDAATENGLGSPYKLGDANLDGLVNGVDFVAWNSNKFTQSLLWSDGDFTADGFVDGVDFVAWNNNKFTASDVVSAVPEPGIALIAVLGICLFVRTTRVE